MMAVTTVLPPLLHELGCDDVVGHEGAHGRCHYDIGLRKTAILLFRSSLTVTVWLPQSFSALSMEVHTSMKFVQAYSPVTVDCHCSATCVSCAKYIVKQYLLICDGFKKSRLK